MTKHQQESKAAEFPDDADLALGADFGASNAFEVVGGDPNYHYFLAADDKDASRPDGVHQVRMRGYQECITETCVGGGDGCKLMRIPRKVFEGRREARRKARLNAREALKRPQGVPEDVLVKVPRPPGLGGI